jgi:hypothetical protein
MTNRLDPLDNSPHTETVVFPTAEIGSASGAPDITYDRKERLIQIRDRLTEAVATVEARYLAPLTKELAAVLRELESMPGDQESTLDDLTSRRAARLSDAEVSERAAGGGVSGRGGRRTRSKRRADS